MFFRRLHAGLLAAHRTSAPGKESQVFVRMMGATLFVSAFVLFDVRYLYPQADV
jgi:hypothetical protein